MWPSPHAAAAAEVTRRAVEAIGIENGPSYTHLCVSRGGPEVIEVAARLGGGHDAELVLAATGVDLNGLALAAALGEPVSHEDVTRGLPGAGRRGCDAISRRSGRESWSRSRSRRGRAASCRSGSTASRGTSYGPLRRASDRAGAVLAVGATASEALVARRRRSRAHTLRDGRCGRSRLAAGSVSVRPSSSPASRSPTSSRRSTSAATVDILRDADLVLARALGFAHRRHGAAAGVALAAAPQGARNRRVARLAHACVLRFLRGRPGPADLRRRRRVAHLRDDAAPSRVRLADRRLGAARARDRRRSHVAPRRDRPRARDRATTTSGRTSGSRGSSSCSRSSPASSFFSRRARRVFSVSPCRSSGGCASSGSSGSSTRASTATATIRGTLLVVALVTLLQQLSRIVAIWASGTAVGIDLLDPARTSCSGRCSSSSC